MLNEEIWRAIVACDPVYDGQVYYGLVTTRIFCRPSCRSRTPRRENVRLFFTLAEAIEGGFRPCKRCRPDVPSWHSSEQEIAERLCQLLSDNPAHPWTLREMAERLYVSPHYVQRCFTRVMGMSPKRYLLALRLAAAREKLAETEHSITEVALASGFVNLAHFSALFRRETGCSPTVYRQRISAERRQDMAR